MPTSILPRIYGDITIENADGSSQVYTVHEGDIVNNLVYVTNGVEHTISGAVRVINCATTRATIAQTCPPESYFDRLVQVPSLIIDSSARFDAELQQVNIRDITSIGTITVNEVIMSNGADLAESIDNLEAGQTLLVPAGTYDDAVTITKSVQIVGQGDVKITAPMTINAPDSAVTLSGLQVVPESVGAAVAAIDVVAGNLKLTNCKVSTVSTGEEACCIRKEAAAANSKSTISLDNCTIEMNVAGDGSAYSYPIALGRFDTSGPTGQYDMGNCDLEINNCTITGNIASGQTYCIYSAARGTVNINIVDATLSAWATVYMNRNGQTETNGTFQDDFSGSSITIDHCTINSTQPFKGRNTVETDVNDFAPFVVQNSQNTDMDINNCRIDIRNNPDVEIGEGERYAPMHVVSITNSQGAELDVISCAITMQDPLVDKAIEYPSDTISKIDGNSFVAVDADGNPIESDCVLV